MKRKKKHCSLLYNLNNDLTRANLPASGNGPALAGGDMDGDGDADYCNNGQGLTVLLPAVIVVLTGKYAIIITA
jgi:hypothetical protein